MIATNIEQSKELLRLGLPAESADMSWYDIEYNNPCKNEGVSICDYYVNSNPALYIPAWSLSALLEVMPKSFKRWCLISNMKDYYWCTFEQNDGHIIKEFYAEKPIIAAFEMVCWLLENNLIKEGANDESRS